MNSSSQTSFILRYGMSFIQSVPCHGKELGLLPSWTCSSRNDNSACGNGKGTCRDTWCHLSIFAHSEIDSNMSCRCNCDCNLANPSKAQRFLHFHDFAASYTNLTSNKITTRKNYRQAQRSSHNLELYHSHIDQISLILPSGLSRVYFYSYHISCSASKRVIPISFSYIRSSKLIELTPGSYNTPNIGSSHVFPKEPVSET